MAPDVREDLGLETELADLLAIWAARSVNSTSLHTTMVICSRRADSPLLDCSDAAGLVSSMYSTPNASSAFAIAILVLVSKNAFANCSPSDHRSRATTTSHHDQ